MIYGKLNNSATITILAGTTCGEWVNARLTTYAIINNKSGADFPF